MSNGQSEEELWHVDRQSMDEVVVGGGTGSTASCRQVRTAVVASRGVDLGDGKLVMASCLSRRLANATRSRLPTFS